jgi:uncharacterized protein YjbI with pentapeptide repeats
VAQWWWLLATTVALYLIAVLINRGACPPHIIQTWASHACTLFKRQGYLLVPTVIAAYAGLYAIMEARHERRTNGVLFERGTFMTMVSSGNRETLIAAMKTFGPVQTRPVPREPDLLKPWYWLIEEKPNEEPLRLWARDFLIHCTVEKCGNPGGNPRPYRINLRNANLQLADLRGSNLTDTDLTLANLRGAKLSVIIGQPLVPTAGVRMSTRIPSNPNALHIRLPDPDFLFTMTMTPSGPELTSLNYMQRTVLVRANLFWADLRDADLTGAELAGSDFILADLRGAKFNDAHVSNARLDRADLRGADLVGATGLSQQQLDLACGDETTKIPDPLKPPPQCP